MTCQKMADTASEMAEWDTPFKELVVEDEAFF